MSDSALISANTRFAFKLFAELTKQDQGQNVFVSPASVALALTMAYNGARGETRRVIAEALELGGIDPQEISRANAGLRRQLQDLGPQVRLAIANSLWTRKGIAFDPEFLRENEASYGAEIAELDFADPRAPSIVNDWVRRNTGGKIERIIDMIDPAAMLFLLNAIYFKGNWTQRFDQAQTQPRPFTLASGGQKTHPMMAQSGSYRYYEESAFQAISLPYGDARLSMYIFLPAQRSNLAAFYRTLNSKSWDTWMRRFDDREGSILLPRFRLEYEKQLDAALKSLGMAVAFDPRRADFTGMCRPSGPSTNIWIDEIRHKTFVEVNEEGTEAAAATAVTMVLAAFTPQQRFRMVVDRPFFCAIRDDRTGALLFMGAVVDPRQA